MFCFQCQEAAKGSGCTVKGVCGKTADESNLQDLLVFALKGVSLFSTTAREAGIARDNIDKFITKALFATVTNTNFDRNAIIDFINKTIEIREELREEIKNQKSGSGKYLSEEIENTISRSKILHDSTKWQPKSADEYEKMPDSAGVLVTQNEDLRSLQELITYGIKGMAAYTEHAMNLGHNDRDIHEFMQKALVKISLDNPDTDELVNLVLDTGKHGVKAMELLDKANTSAYGNPEMTKVNIGTGSNPGILISGHDLKDMEELLKQTEGTGVDVYTHSEMLPAHYYPEFKKYKHFVGNYGSSWWKQKEEFETFNGPILFTTNCIVPPAKEAGYKDRVYTTGAAGFDGFPHIAEREEGGEKDFTPIVDHAKKCKPPVEIEKGEITGGFAHAQVTALADKVVDAVKSGAIRKFFVMAGCDGRMKNREYYTEFAKNLPEDTVILTAGCAKYRYNKLQLGDIGGIPRVLDAGQCNDSYSLAVIAMKLKEAFNLEDANELPIAFSVAWYEQKAVIVLLALLYLGFKNIHLGPTLPAFLSPNVTNVLVEKFGIGGISDVESDIKMFLG